ncbi:MAG: tetratricopeptide repeat protein [Pseudomonadales bacterium]
MRDDLLTGHVSLLLTDIEGSTRLLHRLGAEGYARAQAEHRTVLRAAFAAHGGVEVDTQGDAFFYVFPSARQCVGGAVAATRGLAGFAWSHGDPVKVRMGMHSGEPQPTDEGYVGIVVNMAARISAIGHGGQILLSAASAAELGDSLAASGITLRDMGEHRLKDLDQPQRLYQIVIPELPADFPPLRSAAQKPNNLPVPLTPFIGRAQLVAQVRDLLLQPGTRAVTLLGPGGTGKTRLSIRVGNELLHNLDDGAFFVGLAPVRDPGLVLSQIGGALSVKERAGQTLLDTLCETLAPKQLLLILDNFEQVQGAARDVAALLARCPGLKLLVTSRQPLRISGERGFPVPPLALPDPGAPLPPLAEVGSFEAVRLFVERAQAARWDFELTDANAAEVVEICRKVDGLPLAIELATARLYAMSTTELLKALDQRLNVLTDGAVDLLDHQQTLRDLVAWSYDLLDEDAQRLWRRLAIFAGGAAVTAADAVCNAEGTFRIPGDIDDLAAKSLLNLEFVRGASLPGAEDEGPRHRIALLETLREYAAEMLDASGERDALAERHLDWFRGLVEHAAGALRGPRLDEWLRRFDQEQANLRSAMGFGFAHPGQADAAARIVGVLYFYFYQRGQLSEGRQWLERAIACGEELAPEVRARALFGLANLERSQGRAEAALEHCEAALALFRSCDDAEGIADTLSQLGAILQHLGQFDRAETVLAEAVERLRAIDNQGRLAFALVLLGALRQMRDDLRGAADAYEESLRLSRQVGDKNYIATALLNLGEVQVLRGDGEAAALNLRESLLLYRELGVRNAIAYVLEMLAGIDAAAGRCAEAAVLFGAADRLRELLGAPVESFNQGRYQSDLSRAREGMSDADFAAAWEQGRTMELDAVIGAAQHDLEELNVGG